MLILLVVTILNSFVASVVGIFVILIGNGVYDVFMDPVHRVSADTPTTQTTLETKKPKAKTTKSKTKKA
jgi:hypothetical protein